MLMASSDDPARSPRRANRAPRRHTGISDGQHRPRHERPPEERLTGWAGRWHGCLAGEPSVRTVPPTPKRRRLGKQTDPTASRLTAPPQEATMMNDLVLLLVLFLALAAVDFGTSPRLVGRRRTGGEQHPNLTSGARAVAVPQAVRIQERGRRVP